MATWAQKAGTPTGESSPSSPTPASPAAATDAALMPPPASTSRSHHHSNGKANSSDNWRASAKPVSSSHRADRPNKAAPKADQPAPENDEGGWETVEKKDKPAVEKKQSTQQKNPRSGTTRGGDAHGKKATGKKSSDGKKKDDAKKRGDHQKESSGESNAASSTSTSTSKQANKPLTSWADDDQDALPILTPSFTATTAAVGPEPDHDELAPLPEAVVPTPTPTAPPSPTRESADPIEQSKPQKEAKKPAAPPKVNVWSVRKDQIAAAAAAAPSTSDNADDTAKDSTQTPSAPAAVPTPAPTKNKKKKSKASAPASTAAKNESTKSSQAQAATPSTSTSDESAPVPAPAPKRPAPIASWSNASAQQKKANVPTVVAGEDATSWPAPEEVKEKKEDSKERSKNQDKDEQTKPQSSNAAGKKKKGEKWIPIKTEITVAPGSNGGQASGSKAARKTANRSAANSASNEKKSQQGKKDEANKPAHPLPSKPTTKGAASANKRQGAPSRASLLDSGSVDADGVLRPFASTSQANASTSATVSSPSTSNSASPSVSNAQEPAGENAADLSTPATTAAPSTTDSEPTKENSPSDASTAQAKPATQQQGRSIPSHPHQIQPPNFPHHNLPHAPGAFRGNPRGRGGMRGGAGAAGGRGGARGGFGGRSGPTHHQQQQAAAAAALENGMIPIPVQIDSFGYPMVDAHGYPIPVGGGQAPVVQAQIPPGCIDPRMLDPTRYWLLGQLEWWFSIDNLCRDLFLRSKMDANGWVLISILASFNRIKNLTSDLAIVVECLRMTPLLEVSPKGTHVRLRQQWPEWVLPNATTNEEVKREFEEAEKEKKTKEAETEVATEGANDKSDETKPVGVKGSVEDTTEKKSEAQQEAEQPSTPDADEVSIRSPTLKSQSSPPNHVSPKALPAQPVLDTAVASVTTTATSPKSATAEIEQPLST
ncbi:La RNA-binding domain-containing protein [Sporobolomyces koalae]|uniref:La RNA-binding domain-containing protein n=1 Tax=Sporobolomyces koalae TaxID=500713 RepID=UPI0031792F27